MNKLIPLIFISASVHAVAPDVIYGPDNRLETVESKSSLHVRLAASTAAMISKDYQEKSGSRISLGGQTIDDFLLERFHGELCSDERFKGQVAVADCSGFLVAPDVIATAGHCYMSGQCSDSSWVFNYKVKAAGDKTAEVSEADIYHCKEVIVSQIRPNDFALVRLDRVVKGVQPLKLSAGIPKKGTPLVVIGHPTGLPQKIADGAVVVSESGGEIKANLDTFGGNSGSAVFHDKTGEVVGILVNGAADYDFDKVSGCVRPVRMANNKGEEGVTASTVFAEFLK